jgi:hypothetical protein
VVLTGSDYERCQHGREANARSPRSARSNQRLSARGYVLRSNVGSLCVFLFVDAYWVLVRTVTIMHFYI